MGALTGNAAALLAAIGSDHRVEGLEPDENGLITLDFDGETIAIGFSPVWNSVFLTAVLAADSKSSLADAFRPFRLGSGLAQRNTRLASDEESGALILVREMPLQGLAYPAFNAALATFLDDLEYVRRDLGIPNTLGSAAA